MHDDISSKGTLSHVSTLVRKNAVILKVCPQHTIHLLLISQVRAKPHQSPLGLCPGERKHRQHHALGQGSSCQSAPTAPLPVRQGLGMYLDL